MNEKLLNNNLENFIETNQDKNISKLPLSFEEATSYDYLFQAMLKCRKGVSWKNGVLAYLKKGVENISNLEKKIRDGTYQPKPPVHFIVYSPKKRDIVATNFEDRVYQRSINDNIIYPIMTKSLIKENCACQKGKGTDFGRNLLKQYLFRQFKKINSNNFYCLQIDIKGYYPNMRHDYIEELFKKKLDDKTYQFVIQTLHSQYPNEIGYNAGSQLVQIAGISCLDKLDHYCKEQKHCRYYIRYMDDIVILHEDKTFLQNLQIEIENELSKIGFKFNDKKTRIYHQKKRIKFLGFEYSISNTGKIMIVPNGNTIKRDFKHWKRMLHAITNQKYLYLTKQKVIDSINSTLSYLKRAKARKINAKIITFLNQVKELKLWQELST